MRTRFLVGNVSNEQAAAAVDSKALFPEEFESHRSS